MIGMALMAVLMCVNFTACSEDDPTGDSSTNHLSNANKLAKVMQYDIKNNKKELNDIIRFEYDKNDNVVKIHEIYGSDADDIDITEYIWDSNKSITSYWENDEYIKYTLTNNQITDILMHEYVWDWDTETRELDEDFYRLTYDKDGNLMEYWAKYNEEDEYELEERLTWDNGRLSFYEDYNSLITLRYSDKTCKGFFPLLYEYVNCDDYLFMAQPELVGIKMSYLPSKIIDGNCTISFEYELDTEGYVGSCAVNKYYSYDYDYNGDGRDDYNSYDYLYEFVWE